MGVVGNAWVEGETLADGLREADGVALTDALGETDAEGLTEALPPPLTVTSSFAAFEVVLLYV